MAEKEAFIEKMSRKYPEFRDSKPPGLFLRITSLGIDVSLCSWLISYLLIPVGRRYRERFVEILGLRSFELAISAGTSKSSEVAQKIQESLRETSIDLTEMNLAFGIAVVIISLAVTLGYVFLFEASPLSATPGQAACGIRVVREDLRKLGVFGALMRMGARGITLLTGGLGLFTIFFNRKRLSLHDWLSSTRLLRIKSSLPKLYLSIRFFIFLGLACSSGFLVYQRVLVVSRWYHVAQMAMPTILSIENLPWESAFDSLMKND